MTRLKTAVVAKVTPDVLQVYPVLNNDVAPKAYALWFAQGVQKYIIKEDNPRMTLPSLTPS
jgi:hypothetical protein